MDKLVRDVTRALEERGALELRVDHAQGEMSFRLNGRGGQSASSAR